MLLIQHKASAFGICKLEINGCNSCILSTHNCQMLLLNLLSVVNLGFLEGEFKFRQITVIAPVVTAKAL